MALQQRVEAEEVPQAKETLIGCEEMPGPRTNFGGRWGNKTGNVLRVVLLLLVAVLQPLQ